MFENPLRSHPFVQDVNDVAIRLSVRRADSALYAASEMRLPHLRIV